MSVAMGTVTGGRGCCQLLLVSGETREIEKPRRLCEKSRRKRIKRKIE